MILLDEPELHLNPRLIRSLPDFYHKHLGEALDNQVWLITHSDALLREAVGHEGYSVFHMQPASVAEQEQAIELLAKEGLQKAVIDLVGDLAAYRPDAKLVIFEGESSEFDQRMTNTLFPAFQQAVNTISAGSKQRVRGLQEVLASALETGQIPLKVFSIVDSDADEASLSSAQCFSWDVYHIENYLLESKFVLKVSQDLGVEIFTTEEDVYVALRECAAETMTGLLRHRLTVNMNNRMLATLNLKIDPESQEVASLLTEAASRSSSRMAETVTKEFTLESIKAAEVALRDEFNKALAADSWRKKFRGREILKRFVDRIGGKVSYEVFRNLIIANMRDASFQPDGMRQIVEGILKSA